MPDQSANLTTLRTDSYSTRVYASFITGAVVASGTVTALPSYPASNIAVSFSVGDETDCAYGYEVTIHDGSTGALKYRTHIRHGGTISSTNLPVREYSRARMYLVPSDVFKVWSAPRLHDKLVAGDVTFAPDLAPYVDQNEAPAPVATSGGHCAQQVDDSETFASVQMVGTTAYPTDPASNPLNISHLWTLPTGVAFATGSSDTDPSPVLEVDVGEYMVVHTVTDDDNGKSRTQYVNIRVHDDADPPHQVLIESLTDTAEDGCSWTIEVLEGDTDLDTIPDGCLAILWTRERHAGAWQSFRGDSLGREHILGVGYVSRDTTSLGEDGFEQIRFEVISPLARLRQITSYSKVMEEAASPNAWSEFEPPLRVERAIHQIINYYTTLVEAGHDWIVDAAVLDRNYPAFYLNRGSFLDQINQLANGVDARFVCDRSGRFELHTHPAFIPLDDRSSVTEVFELEAQDILEWEMSRDHFHKVEQYKTSGVAAGGTAAVFSLYPGAAPGEAIETPTKDRLIVDGTNPQLDLNQRTGRYGGLADGLFIDEDYIEHKAFELRLQLWGAYDVLGFRKEYVRFALTNNRRGIDLTAFRFYPTSINVSYPGDGSSLLDVTLRMETSAPSGETLIVLPEQQPIYTPPDFIPPVWQPPGIPGGRLPPWNGVDQTPLKLFVLSATSAQAFIASSWNPASGTQTWTEVSTGLSGNGIWFSFDPWNYKKCFALTTDGLYVNPDVTTGGSWSQVGDNDTMFGDSSYIGHNVLMSINRRGYIAIPTGTNTLAVTFDYGTNWTAVGVHGSAGGATSLSVVRLQAALSPFNNGSDGRLFAFFGLPASANAHLYRSDDWGASWTLVESGNTDLVLDSNIVATPAPHLYYILPDGDTANENGASQQVLSVLGSGNRGQINRSVTAGAPTWAQLEYVNAASTPRPDGSLAGHNLMSFTHDGSVVYFASTQGLGVTTDDFANVSYTTNILPGASAGGIWVQGFAAHIGAVLAGNRGGVAGGRLVWSLDGLANVVSCTLPSGVTFVACGSWMLDHLVPPG